MPGMKDGPCPKCQTRELYEISEAHQADHDSANATYPLTLTAVYGPSGESGFFGDKMTRVGVTVAAHVCSKCGYTELYANGLDELERFAREGTGNVRKVRR